MRCSCILIAVALLSPLAGAQRHAGSPPTAPARPAPPAPVFAASSGLGPIQFVSVNYGVPAPQTLTRQLRVDDERTRAGALSAIGVPAQYLQRGHVALPHSVELEFASLSNDDELDALVTVELDQHIVTAVLVPDDSNWRRIATVFVADSFSDPRTTPATFVRTTRAMLERGRYTAIFHATAADAQGNYAENEAHLRIFNKRAVITVSFVSASRDCPPTPGGKKSDPGCNVLRRWLQPDPADPYKRFTLVTATGRISLKEAGPLSLAPAYEASHLRSFACQSFVYSDSAQRFDPAAPSVPCPVK